MEYGSLFTGIGGFDRGLDDAGMSCAWQVEIDKRAVFVLEKQWPTVRRYGDICDVGEQNLRKVGLIVGGFPCQDLSVAGRGEGLVGERSGLWFEFHRIIRELRPEWVVIENVPGLLSSHKGKDFAILLGGLTGVIPTVPKRGWGNAGLARGPIYKVAYRTLDAQFFGVAQRRRRVFIVASLGTGCAAQVLFERSGSGWNSPSSGEEGEEVTEAVARCVDVRNLRLQPGELSGTLQSKKTSGYSLNYQNPVIVEQEDYVPDVSRPLAASSTINHYDESQQTYVAFGGNRTSGKIEKATAINAGHGSRRYDFDTETFLTFNNRQDPIISEDVSQPIGSKDNGLGICWEMSHPDDPARQHGDVAPTLQRRMGTGGNQVPMIGVRRLTPTECERLQGFPDHWTAVLSKYPGRMAKEDIDYFRNQLEDSYGRPFSDDEVRKIASDTARYQQLGNAVAVPVARWLGKRIVMVDRMYNW